MVAEDPADVLFGNIVPAPIQSGGDDAAGGWPLGSPIAGRLQVPSFSRQTHQHGNGDVSQPTVSKIAARRVAGRPSEHGFLSIAGQSGWQVFSAVNRLGDQLAQSHVGVLVPG